jgi:hypothetical protein
MDLVGFGICLIGARDMLCKHGGVGFSASWDGQREGGDWAVRERCGRNAAMGKDSALLWLFPTPHASLVWYC